MPDAELKSVVTKSEFSRAMSVNRSQPTRWAKAGMPVRPDGLIDVAEAVAWVRHNIDPGARATHQAGVAPTVAQHAGEPRNTEPDLPAFDGAPTEVWDDVSAEAPIAAEDAGTDLDLVAERARLASAQADRVEMQNAVTRASTILKQDAVTAMQASITNSRARLLALPTRAAPLVIGMTSPAAIRDVLTELVHEALAELAMTRLMPDEGEHSKEEA